MQGHDDIDCMVYHSAEEAASLNIRRTAFIASEHEWHKMEAEKARYNFILVKFACAYQQMTNIIMTCE
jgi:hypothetical protein